MKNLILFTFSTLLLLGCTKSKNEKRLSGGIWKVETYKVNGVDLTTSTQYQNIKGYKFVLDGTKENRKENYTFDRIYVVMTDGQEINFGHWGERNNDKMMLTPEYAFLENIPTDPFINCGCFPKYDIDYIHKDKMKFSINYNEMDYELIFKKI